MNAEFWNSRTYHSSDDQEIITLFNKLSNSHRSLEFWRWRFKENPYSEQAILSLGCSNKTGKIVGQYAVMPLRLNFLGKPILACQSVDTLVSPEFQGQKMFTKTANHCYSQCVQKQVRAVYGFPNRNSYPGFMRNLGWRKISYLKKYYIRLNIKKKLKSFMKVEFFATLFNEIYTLILKLRFSFLRLILKKKIATAKVLKFTASSSIPDGYESLWNVIKNYQVLSIWKDAAYLRWRYEQNPRHIFDYFYLKRNNEILAFAVAHSKKDTVSICEFMVLNNNVLKGKLLLNEMQSYYVNKGKKCLIFVGLDLGYFQTIFRKFEDDPAFGFNFCGRVFEVKDELNDFFPFPFNWTVTYGDVDAL
jgi:hypothetical protein